MSRPIPFFQRLESATKERRGVGFGSKCLVYVFMLLVAAVHHEVKANYDVAPRKRIIHSTTPTPLNSAGSRGQHRCRPGSEHGLRSIAKRDRQGVAALQLGHPLAWVLDDDLSPRQPVYHVKVPKSPLHRSLVNLRVKYKMTSTRAYSVQRYSCSKTLANSN